MAKPHLMIRLECGHTTQRLAMWSLSNTYRKHKTRLFSTANTLSKSISYNLKLKKRIHIAFNRYKEDQSEIK